MRSSRVQYEDSDPSTTTPGAEPKRQKIPSFWLRIKTISEYTPGDKKIAVITTIHKARFDEATQKCCPIPLP